MKRLAEAFIFVCLGGAFASVWWAGQLPDQPVKQCIPLYDQTGLECCQ